MSSAIKPKSPVVGTIWTMSSEHSGGPFRLRSCRRRPIPIPLAIHGIGPNVSEYRLIGPGRYLATTFWANNGGSTEATFCFAPVHFQAFLYDTDGNRADLTGDEFGCTGSVRSPVTVARATNVYVSVSHSWGTASWSVTFDKLD